jgi:hypothetical protein
MIVTTGVERKEKKRKTKKKEEEEEKRNLVYLGLCYFGAIFELKLSC